MDLVFALALAAVLAVGFHIVGFGFVAPQLINDMENLFQGEPGAFVFVGVMFLFGFGVVVWGGMVKLQKISWRQMGWHTDNLGRQIIFGVGFGAATICCSIGLSMAFGSTADEIKEGLFGPSLSSRLLFACIGLMAGIVEESVFRGGLVPALTKRMPWLAAWPLQAIVFSLYHLPRRLPQVLGRTMTGLMYGAAAKTNQGLVAAAIAHFLTWSVVGGL